MLEDGIHGWRPQVCRCSPLPSVRASTAGHAPPPEDRPHRLSWLIRRFIDPTARFCTPRQWKPSPTGSTQSRLTSMAWLLASGDRCSFDALLDDFHHTDALARLATVIRGADTDRHDLAPQAAGLLALAVGLSRMFRDDLQQLEAGIALYDALYRWARDGHDEGHDWPAGRSD